MPKQIRTRPVTPQQAGAYLGKADEYLEAAVAELEADRVIAAGSCIMLSFWHEGRTEGVDGAG